MIPCLNTERLILRGWRGEDFDSYAAFLADPDVARYLNGEPMQRPDAWRNMAMMVGHWSLRGYGMWAVERKADGAMIGRVGLFYPEGWPALEVGWMLGKSYWGQGYATEAARTAMAFGFLAQGLERIVSVIHTDNKASQAVAARLGETRGPRRDVVFGGKTFPMEVWSIARADWVRAVST